MMKLKFLICFLFVCMSAKAQPENDDRLISAVVSQFSIASKTGEVYKDIKVYFRSGSAIYLPKWYNNGNSFLMDAVEASSELVIKFDNDSIVIDSMGKYFTMSVLTVDLTIDSSANSKCLKILNNSCIDFIETVTVNEGNCKGFSNVKLLNEVTPPFNRKKFKTYVNYIQTKEFGRRD